MADFGELVGKQLVQIRGAHPESERITFEFLDGSRYILEPEMFGDEDVYVKVECIVGNLQDLIDTPILRAEISTEDWCDSRAIWTTFKLITIRGEVNITWLGETRGFKSIEVGFYREKAPRNPPSSPGWYWARVAGGSYVVQVSNLRDTRLVVFIPAGSLVGHWVELEHSPVEVWGPRVTEPEGW